MSRSAQRARLYAKTAGAYLEVPAPNVGADASNETASDAPTGAAEDEAAPVEAAAADAPPTPTKTATVLALMAAEAGASLAELVAATGWLPHTTRAALTGLRKKGHAITRDKVDGLTRYTIRGEGAE